MVMGTPDTKNVTLGISSIGYWWRNSSQYTVYEDFTGSDGTTFAAGRWTLSGTPGSATIQSNEGRVQESYGGAGSASYTATTNAIPIGSSIYAEITTSTTLTQSNNGSTGSANAGFNGVAYWTQATAPASSQSSTVTLGAKVSLRCEYLGGISYDIYVNEVYVTTITSASAVTFFATSTSGANSASTVTINTVLDNVRIR